MHQRDRSPARALAVLSAVLFAGAAVAAGIVLGSPAPARAAAAGTIAVSPTTGSVETSPMFNLALTSAPCPATHKESVALKIGPAAGPPSSFKSVAQPRSEGNFDKAPVSMVPNKSFAKALGAAGTPGDYLLIVVCLDAENKEYSQRFETKVSVAGGTWTAASETVPATETTTVLAVTPTGQAQKGDPVTMTATVAPVSAAGTVTFRAGNGVIGSPVPVVQGVATLTVTSLVAGVNQLSAAFTPADPAGFVPSTSAVIAYQINAPLPPPSATGTTTVLAVTPTGQAQKGDPVKMTATVAPVSAAGTVTFRAGNSVIGNPVPVVQGMATVTVTSLVAGVNQLSAAFTPTDPTAFAPSTSTVIAYQINASASPSPSPSTDPTDDPPDEPEPSDSPTPTPTPSPSDGDSLPKTGPAVAPVAAWGVGLLVAGIAAMLLARRRTRP